MAVPDLNGWIDEIKAMPGAEGVGMMLAHRGVVRGTTRAGDPVSSMDLSYDRDRLAVALEEAKGWDGIFEIKIWINEGHLEVGDDIMQVIVAGDIRPNVIDALQKFVGVVKSEVVQEVERP